MQTVVRKNCNAVLRANRDARSWGMGTRSTTARADSAGKTFHRSANPVTAGQPSLAVMASTTTGKSLDPHTRRRMARSRMEFVVSLMSRSRWEKLFSNQT
jgi:hypothetical protein